LPDTIACVGGRVAVAEAMVTVGRVGLESRDWFREEARKSRRPRASRWFVAALVLAGLTLVAVSPPVSDRLGYEPPFGIGHAFDREPSAIGYRLFPGGPTITTYERPLYADDDPWHDWLAPETTCPRGDATGGSAGDQIHTMLCLLNYARAREGLRPLARSTLLSGTSLAKAREIVKCQTFAHEPCGLPADHAARAAGYRGPFGENIYAAEGRWVAPRVAVDQWLNSPGHRENLFRPQWGTIGIGLLRDAAFEPYEDGVIWVNQFGDR
jgi:hypothetical protein